MLNPFFEQGQQEFHGPPPGLSSREQIQFHINHVLNIVDDGIDLEDEAISAQELETLIALQGTPLAQSQGQQE
jgi:hypothetical protein